MDSMNDQGKPSRRCPGAIAKTRSFLIFLIFLADHFADTEKERRIESGFKDTKQLLVTAVHMLRIHRNREEVRRVIALFAGQAALYDDGIVDDVCGKCPVLLVSCAAIP
jgi:hypothetical protein